MKFLGFRRPDGKVGIRNHVLVLATVGCAAEAARQTADGIYGAVSFINQNGCGESSRNLRRTQDVLVGMAANPNVYGVVAIGLGCEMNRMDGFIKELRARTDKPIEGLLIQEEGGTIETVAKAKKLPGAWSSRPPCAGAKSAISPSSCWALSAAAPTRRAGWSQTPSWA